MSTDARDTFRHWARRMLFHHHRMERSPEAVGEVYQTSTMARRHCAITVRVRT
jgi:hypothetical protein